MDSAFKGATYRLKGFIDTKINCSLCEGFLGENFQAPHKQRFGFCDSSLFVATMTLIRHYCDTFHLLRSEKQTCGHTILKYQEKRQVTKE